MQIDFSWSRWTFGVYIMWHFRQFYREIAILRANSKSKIWRPLIKKTTMRCRRRSYRRQRRTFWLRVAGVGAANTNVHIYCRRPFIKHISGRTRHSLGCKRIVHDLIENYTMCSCWLRLGLDFRLIPMKRVSSRAQPQCMTLDESSRHNSPKTPRAILHYGYNWNWMLRMECHAYVLAIQMQLERVNVCHSASKLH